MWCPPTPPQDGNDIYIDYSLAFLYDTCAVMDDTQLPAVYVRKEYKRMRTDDGFYIDGRRPLKIRKDDGYIPPRSLFDRPSPAIAKMRKDLKQQRNRGLIRSMPMANIKQQIPLKPLIEPEGMAEWLIFEDRAILNVIQNLQGLPLNLMLISPGHTPNWDLVADIVNQSSRTYRSPKQCRWRYEAVIVPREEGKLMDSPKKQKKNKNLLKTAMKNSRSPRTAQLYQNDNNNSFIKLTKLKFEAIKTAIIKKQPQMKKYMGNTPLNQKHLSVLNELGIAQYDQPPSPIDFANRCYERLIQDRSIAQQKMEQQVKMQTKPPLSGTTQMMPDQLSTMQIQQQSSPMPSSQTQMTSLPQATIVVQPGSANIVSTPTQQTQQGQQSITALVHGTTIQGQRIQTQTINLTPSQNSQQQQIMKAIVASPGGTNQQALLSGIIQQMNPQMQNSQSNLIQTSSVSVVLTSPPSTVTSVQPQIVSIQPTVATSTSMVTQSGTSNLVQTINSQGQAQVVSVSQLAIGSTSLTAQSQSQIRQRAISKDFILQHRPGSQPGSVISITGLSPQNFSQLRFSNITQQTLRAANPRQQVVGPQIWMQKHVRPQQLRFIQTGQIAQIGTAQTTQVTSSGVSQGLQVPSGPKITVAAINPAAGSQQQVTQVVGQPDGVDSPQATTSGSLTLQVGPQQRQQFMKQPQTQQNLNPKVIMLKQHEHSQPYKTQLQLTNQTQLYASTGNIQLQQPSGSTTGQQQQIRMITTSGASGITTVAGAVPIGMKMAPRAANQAGRSVPLQSMSMGIHGIRKPAAKVPRMASVSSRGSLVVHDPKTTVKPAQSQIFLTNPGMPVSSVSSQTLQVSSFVISLKCVANVFFFIFSVHNTSNRDANPNRKYSFPNHSKSANCFGSGRFPKKNPNSVGAKTAAAKCSTAAECRWNELATKSNTSSAKQLASCDAAPEFSTTSKLP